MKKYFLSLGLIVAAMFTLTNCTEQIDAPVESAKVPFEIIASTAETKTTNDGMSTEWSADDAINLFHEVAGGAGYVDNGAFTITADNLGDKKFTGTIAGELDPDKVYNWYAIYPHSPYITTPANTSSGYTYIGHSNGLSQNGYNSMASLKGNVCPLYGVLKGNPAATTPAFIMNHLSSVIAINVTNANDAPLTITTASFTAPEDIVGSYYIDITKTPVVYTTNNVKKTAVVNVTGGTELEKNESAIIYAAIKPFTATTGQTLTLSVNGYSKDLVLTKNVTFSAGKIKTLNFAYDKVEAAGEYTITWNSADDWAEESTKFVSGYYTIKTQQGDASTAPTVNVSQKDCRVYGKGNLTISHSASVNIKKLVFNISTNGQKRLTDITASTGSVTVDAQNWKVTWEGDASSVTFTVGEKATYGTDGVDKSGQLCFDSIDVQAEPTDAPYIPVLKKITLAGMTTEYVLGDSFDFDGTVTAYYFNQDQQTVTPTNVIEPEMTKGNKTVTVEYTEGDVTVSASYGIYVSDPNEEVGDSKTETITFSSLNYENGTAVESVTSGDVKIDFTKGTNNSNAPKYYSTGSAVRAYGGNTFTISAANSVVTKVAFTFGTGDGTNEITVNVGNYSEGTWTGNAEAITFTIEGNTGNRRLSTIEVTYSNN